MKKYFEYPVNDEIKKKILDFYEDVNIDMHNSQTQRKTKIKMERILNEVQLKETDCILDIGCSSGELLKMLHSNIAKGIGLDIAASVIDKNNKENPYQNISYKVFDGVNIELQEKADKAFMLDVLEHSFEPDKLMDSVHEVIKSGGGLVLEVPTTGWLSELVFGKYHMGHLRYYDPNSVKTFLDKHGFEVLSIKAFNAVPAGVKMLKKRARFYKCISKVCNCIPPKMYPYYGSVVAIASKR